MPCGTVHYTATVSTLILSVVATDFLSFAIANAFVRFHLDNAPNLHPNGVENDSWSCLSIHVSIVVSCKDNRPLVSAPPLGKRKKTDTY